MGTHFLCVWCCLWGHSAMECLAGIMRVKRNTQTLSQLERASVSQPRWIWGQASDGLMCASSSQVKCALVKVGLPSGTGGS